jgi:hypothetical protein
MAAGLTDRLMDMEYTAAMIEDIGDAERDPFYARLST